MQELKNYVVYYGENGCMKTVIQAEDYVDAQRVIDTMFSLDELPIASVEEDLA